MLSIEAVRRELEHIPGALWLEEADPFQRPRPRVAGGGGGTVFVVDDQPEIRDEGGLEDLLEGVDKRVTGAASGTATGIEALAWYASFHQVGNWGIFIPMSSLVCMERKYLRDLHLTTAEKYQVALDLLLQHELLHFSTDVAVAQWETLLRAPSWKAVTEQRISSNTYLQLEEALANAFMLRTTRRLWSVETRRAVRCFVESQPAGYNEADHYRTRPAFSQGLRNLILSYVGVHATERELDPLSVTFDFTRAFQLNPARLQQLCPVHVFDDLSQRRLPKIALQIIERIPDIQESSRFKKCLHRMPQPVKDQWNKKKRQLADYVPSHPEFEKLSGYKDLFSIRLNRGYRAHLTPPKGGAPWTAIFIGTHTAAGHD